MSKGIPTSDDIYFRIIHNGVSKKVAIVESYKVSRRKETKTQDAFGEKESVATYSSKTSYELEITRAYATDEAISDGIFLDELEDFEFVIEKPDRTEIYSMCNWNEVSEDGKLKDKVTENMRFTAAKFKRVKK
ncbi:hypothetical protein FQB35_10455 [Crassaminicella thermophila]|uniref:Phage tail tube protein n=1 Tax=Crassaminicella thermophila TaxID=2599308 RepID=A0A5C0SGD2_CRATE|nr:hypothetical protein [Crassaminicella thermophila]QEK12717.1 hypothetical protein FQB35_10455 [Crassaminicella thermophila]